MKFVDDDDDDDGIKADKLSAFYRAVWNADAVYSDENLSVCPSVRLFCQTRGLWQNGRKICLDFYTYTKDHLS